MKFTPFLVLFPRFLVAFVMRKLHWLRCATAIELDSGSELPFHHVTIQVANLSFLVCAPLTLRRAKLRVTVLIAPPGRFLPRVAPLSLQPKDKDPCANQSTALGPAT
jgi:hypothetical protein